MPRSHATEIGEKVEGEGRIRRYHANVDALTTRPFEEVSTLYELLAYSAKKRPEAIAFGTRPLIKVHVDEKEVKNAAGVVEKKKWTSLELGPYEWKTYQKVAETVGKLGTALASEQLGSLTKGSIVGIFAETSEQWLTFAHAVFSQSAVVATVYANLGEEGLVYAINDTSLTHLLTDSNLLGSILKSIASLPKIKYIFYTDHREQADVKVLEALKEKGITTVSFSELVTISSGLEAAPVPPAPTDLAVIMYTSGTTGLPKGVMISHANVIGAISGGMAVVVSGFNLGPGDLYCSFLPLAHILEMVIEHCLILSGAGLAFGSPRTMTDNLVRNCKGDLTESKPTLMAGVPTLWERIRKGALEKVKMAPASKQKVFNVGYSIKNKLLSMNIASAPVLDSVVFGQFKQNVGGRLRGIISGGAPLSHSTHQFLRTVFNVPVIQGYGLTETCGLLTVQPLRHLGTEIVGAPFPCAEIKLVDVKEMGYTSEDQPNPRGEIWARGPGIAMGYYNQPEKTKEEFKEGGWFATGDIAQWNSDGTLAIIDRIKNLVKLSHGEYIALEAMEAKYKQDPYVDEICVVANSQKDLPAVLVVVNKPNLTAWAEANSIDASDWVALTQNEKAKEEVKRSLHATATREKMKTFEKPSGVFLVSEEWTVDGGLVTAAMKLKRNEIQKKYKDEIAALFAAQTQN